MDRNWSQSSQGAGSLLLFDGECGLCNAVVRFLLRRDVAGRLRFARLQGEVGQATLRRLGLPTEDFDSLVFLPDAGGDVVRLRTDGVAAVFRAPIGGFLHAIEQLLQGARPVVMLLVLVTTFWADTWADLLGLARLVNLDPDSTSSPSTAIFQLSRQVNTFVVVRPKTLAICLVVFLTTGIAAAA